MENNDEEISNQDNSQKILRYPLNGRSSYLIDKFYIIGYNHSTIQKYLYKDENLKKILEENKLNKENSGDLDLQKFNIEENPKVLNEFVSDYEKESMDIDTIMEMMLPKKINLYFSENKKMYSKSPEKKNKKGENINLENDIINSDYLMEDNFCIFDEEENINFKKELLSKYYNVIFSSNPQSGNNSKKSINGFSYVFYKKIKKEKKYLNKIYTFYVPIIFCIISEFPFYNSFYQLSKKLSFLFTIKDIKIPLEILLYNIIKLSPSPLNADVFLSLNLNYLQNSNFKEINPKITKEINNIEEEENDDEEKTDNNFLRSLKISETSVIKGDEALKLETNKKPVEKMKSSEFSKLSFNSRKNKKTVFKKFKTKILSEEINKLDNNDIYLEFSKKIKFDFLTGYPLIQYNLAKVLLQTLSPTDVIVIFFYTFLEKDVIFFSKDLEFLSLTINTYLNLNFPLNDEKYYFNNVTVSYDNYVNQNSTFVGSTFTTIIGINDSYNPKYLNSNMTKLKEHIAIDLDNGKLYKVEDKNDKEKSKKNKELFSFIKHVCKNKETKNEKTILYKEIEILHTTLQNLYDKMTEDDKSKYYEIYKFKQFISYDENIKKLNIFIQDYFYRLINNISMYFYQNLQIKTEGDDLKLKNKMQTNDNNNNIEQEMNVIFLEDYKDEEIYSKEELYFLEELKDTMKFESFVYGFVQSYNPIDLYKIPLTFTEEFISFISRKSLTLNKKINFFGLFDELYEVKNKKEIIIDFKDILNEYYNNYKIYFNRYIEENQDKRGSDKINIRLYNENIIKYKGYELDSRINMKYMKILSDLEQKDEKENAFYKMLKDVENNIPKTISVTDIESVIENYAIDSNILSVNDLCCVNIIILFTLSLRYMKSLVDCQSFLGSLFQNFIVFRKYYSIIMSMVYSLYEESVSKKDYIRAKDYFYLYYLCINSLRNFKLIPNESLMKIIKQFNKINIDALSKEVKENKTEEKKEEDKDNTNNNDAKLYGVNLPEDPITTNNLYMIYNFTSNGSISEKDLVIRINSPNIKDDFVDINDDKYIEPRIRFNNGIHQQESNLFSQRIMIADLVKQYKNYIVNMDEAKLKIKANLDSCLNILIFMRNSKRFTDDGEIIDMVKKIFYIFLNQIDIKNSNN